MSLWKTVLGQSRNLFHPRGSIIPISSRSFETKKHNPTPTCLAKSQKKAKKQSTDCVDDHPKPRSKENIAETFPFYNLIKFKDVCCGSSCIDKDFPSFDKCLYKESDKNRQYQVTWVECPPLKIKPKKICCFAKVTHPPVSRRKPSERPDTACKPEECPKEEGNLKCRRIKMPRCKPVRIPVRCHRVRYPTDCHKVKTPYPAYSECRRPKIRPKRRTECNCLENINYCSLLSILNRRLRQSGTLNLNPCGK